MDLIKLESSRKTPGITLDPAGRIVFAGRSIPEDASKFYEPVLAWVIHYMSAPKPETRVDVQLEYFNSGSAKYLLQILRELNEIPDLGKKLEVNWYYEEGDDDILERGEYYASILNMKINFIETE